MRGVVLDATDFAHPVQQLARMVRGHGDPRCCGRNRSRIDGLETLVIAVSRQIPRSFKKSKNRVGAPCAAGDEWGKTG